MSLSYASGCGEMPLLGETIGQNLDRIARSFPGRDALVAVDQCRRWTYAELNADIDVLARALLAEGVEPGDRIGIWAPNCPEWVLTQYATAKIGAVLVCINPAYSEHELSYVLRQSGVSVLLTITSNRGADYRSMVVAARHETPDLRRVVYFNDASWSELIAGADKTSAEALQGRTAELSFDDPINIQFTSGTTGRPKGATLTHHNILNNGYFVGELLHYSEHDRICIPVPFYHCFGMVMGNLAAISHGAAIIIPSAAFDPAATLRAVQQERCTSLYGVPTMFIAALALPECSTFDLTSLRTGIMAGAPCPIAVMREVIERLHMQEVGICYGMTETSPVSTMTCSDDDIRRRTETVGRAMPHVQVKVVDPATGRLVPRGVVGEMCTRGYSVMRGYWRDSEQTRQALDEAGWMHTGDLAVMDESGYISIVGRIKDMVIRGGENIYPREIEEFLFTHPDIADVQVVGVPDERYGEEVMACIRLREGATPMTAESLQVFCDGRLARYKIPRYVRVMDSFPMTVTGKIRKIDLRRQAQDWLAQSDLDRLVQLAPSCRQSLRKDETSPPSA